MREHDIRSADGTAIRVWRAGGHGRDLDAPDARQWRVHSWYHRGTLGSARPADPGHIRLAHHVADALAVLDDAEAERAVVMGWSAGAAVACELALRHPDRVAGLLLVAGAPGDPFGGMFGVLGLPAGLRRAMASAVAQAVRGAGPLLNAVLHRVPVNLVTAALARHSGVLLPASRNADVVAAGRRFLSHDWRWYGELALALAGEQPPDLSGLTCPITVLVGRYDLIADPRHVARAVGALPQARIRVLPTSHFLPLEAPDDVAAELAMLARRVDAVHGATHWIAGIPEQPTFAQRR